MIILTAANVTKSTHFRYRNKKFSFKAIIQENIAKAETFGYKTVVYDLGNLGIGEPFHIEDESFRTKGYYTEIKGGYQSMSLFKPDIVKKCLETYKDSTVYLDGDALLYDNIDEVISDDFDIGVTLRRVSELENEWHRENIDLVKYINAGVIFFNPTEATLRFIEIWRKLTHEVNNDQMALNKLVCPESRPEVNSIHTFNGARIKYFPGDQYNFYYFDESLSPNLKILHFKGTVRDFYPFDWKMNLYCRTVIPLVNRLRPLIRKRPYLNTK